MLTKDQVVKAMDELPSKFSMEDIMDELLLLQKIEKGKAQSKNNEVIADENLDDALPKWLS